MRGVIVIQLSAHVPLTKLGHVGQRPTARRLIPSDLGYAKHMEPGLGAFVAW
jgi:hypothetical protein